MAKRGILLGGDHNLNYSHKNSDITTLLSSYQDVLSLIAKTIELQDFEQKFHGQVLQPLFEVRE